MKTCQICHRNPPTWVWTPFGPGEDQLQFFEQSHAWPRSLEVIQVCDNCKKDIQGVYQGRQDPITFAYKDITWKVARGEIIPLTIRYNKDLPVRSVDLVGSRIKECKVDAQLNPHTGLLTIASMEIHLEDHRVIVYEHPQSVVLSSCRWQMRDDAPGFSEEAKQ